MNWSKILGTLSLISFSSILFSQVVVSDPIFPKSTDNITVTFDASQGNAGLKDFVGTVYAHTGLITEESKSSTDWKYVQGDWGTADAPIMTSIGNNKYTLNIGSIYQYYGVPQSEKILKIAILFRDEQGSNTGRNIDGSDIFIDIYDNGFYAQLTSPIGNTIYDMGSNIAINGSVSTSASLSLLINGVSYKTSLGTDIEYLFNPTEQGDYEVVLLAVNGGNRVSDTVNFVVDDGPQNLDLPISVPLGIERRSASSIFLSLYAPNKKHVYVVGDFNQWKVKSDYAMSLDSDGSTWWIEIDNLDSTKKYAFQYLVDGSVKIADPYSELVADSWNDTYIDSKVYPNPYVIQSGTFTGYATLIDMGAEKFQWKDDNFNPPSEHELIVYELLVRDFLNDHSYKSLLDTLDYLEKLGVNAIELMPVNEFEGNESWGYNPSYHGALDKYYGTPHDFKALINECHNRGIAVILDVVFNHGFSQNPLCQLYWDAKNNRPTADNPFVNQVPTHDFNVGYDFNHESPAFKAYMKQHLTYWLEEYHIDGYRFDLSKGFTQNNTLGDVGAMGRYDLSRVNNIKRIFNEVRAVNANAYVILEHFSDNSEEKDLANYGCMIWGNISHEGMEASMGYNSNFSWANYKERGWNEPRLIGYPQSHDEERMMYKNLQFGNVTDTYSIKDFNTALDRLELTWVVFNSIPGPKMIWQFGELGYEYSIDYNGRVGNKPIKWEYNLASNRKDVYKVYRAINRLKSTYDAFDGADFDTDLSTKVKRVGLYNPNQSFLVLGNFDVVSQQATPYFNHTGTWYEYFTGDSIDVKDISTALELRPGEYQVWTDKKIVTTQIIGSVDKLGSEINVYPNPFNKSITISNPNGSINSYALMDATGRIIRSHVFATRSNKIDLNLGYLSKGNYILEVSTDIDNYRLKLMR